MFHSEKTSTFRTFSTRAVTLALSAYAVLLVVQASQIV